MKNLIIGIISALVLIAAGRFVYHILFEKDEVTDIQSIKTRVESGEEDYKSGQEAMQAGDYNAAEKHFRDVLKFKNTLNKTNYSNTLLNLGLCYEKQGKFEQARNCWQQAAASGDTTAARNLSILDKQQNK